MVLCELMIIHFMWLLFKNRLIGEKQEEKAVCHVKGSCSAIISYKKLTLVTNSTVNVLFNF